ncbi:very short patch repair endonuclease [Ancylobacter gelatini]|uniref:very short patch repair endonuclease n=1 Tax=Ancylobacter gelatini TaxID=2919920 RepID=UPI0024796761|nr:very short patch repair endonuclease [Ancylobacter gelatini]
MADTLTPQERSERMRRIRGKNTKPEWLVRRMLHNAGYRYRLHRHSLPGKPDLVFPSRKIAIFVHGCFWHQHQGCKVAHIPKSRSEYWAQKFRRNVERDAANEAALENMGWRVIVVWECETADSELLLLRLAEDLRLPLDS